MTKLAAKTSTKSVKRIAERNRKRGVQRWTNEELPAANPARYKSLCTLQPQPRLVPSPMSCFFARELSL